MLAAIFNIIYGTAEAVPLSKTLKLTHYRVFGFALDTPMRLWVLYTKLSRGLNVCKERSAGRKQFQEAEKDS